MNKPTALQLLKFFLFAFCLVPVISAQAAYDNRLRLTADEEAFLAEHPVIRVHNERNWPPINYYENGQAKGYSIDYMNLIANRLGIKIEYISGPSWNEFLTMIKNKELDVMMNIINTEERRKYLLFTEPYMHSFTALFTRDDDDVTTLQDLTNESLAVPKGFYTEELIKKHYPKIRLYTTKDIHGSLLAVMEGNARAAIGDLGVVSYLIKKYKTPGLKAAAKINDKRFSSVLNVAVRDDWPLFRSIVQKAMDSITDAEVLALRNEWFGDANQKLNFDTEEQAYLKEKKTLNIAISPNNPPYSFFDSGVAKGLAPEYMRLIGAQTDFKLNFIWKRPGGITNNTRADIVLGMDHSQENRQHAYLGSPYAHSIPGIFSKTNEQYSRLKELNGKRLAVVRNSLYRKLLKQHNTDIELIDVDDVESAIEAVVFGHADAFIADYNEASFRIQSTGITNISALTAIKDSRFHSELSMAISNGQPVLQRIIQKILRRIDKAEIDILKHDWLQITQTDGDQIALTTWEREYLSKNNTFTFCSNIGWQPFDFVDDESQLPSGIAIDILRLVEQKIGHSTKFSWLPSDSWSKSTRALAAGECDLAPAIVRTKPREQYALFTKPYLNYRAVIITRSEEPFVHSFEEIADRGIARHKGSGMINQLHNRYGGVSIIETDSPLESFQKVAEGEIYATVAILPVASHYITQYGFSNLKIAGFTDIDYPISIAVNKNKPELFSMVEKALVGLEDNQHREVFNKWVSIKVDQQVDYSLYIKTVAAIFIIALFLVYRQYQLGRYNRVLADLSVMDRLTQIYNRNRLDEVLQDQLNLLQRYQTPCSIVFIDVDHFKRINDQHGHLVGDEVLIEIAQQFNKLRRATDIAGRWGGEEFMLICPNTRIQGAENLSEHIRSSVESHQFTKGIRCTCSFGVAELTVGMSIEGLLKQADTALYKAKTSGRNRVSVADQAPKPEN